MTREDIFPLLPLCEAFCGEMGWSFDRESSLHTLKKALESGWFAVVEVEEEKIRGLGLAMLAPFYTDYHNVKAVELAWHSDPSLPSLTRGRIMIWLLEAMEKWASDQGAPLTVSTSTDPTKALLARRGYASGEVLYAKEGCSHG